jgi:hypothetical protein
MSYEDGRVVREGAEDCFSYFMYNNELVSDLQ